MKYYLQIFEIFEHFEIFAKAIKNRIHRVLKLIFNHCPLLDVPNIPYIEVVSVGDTHIAVMIGRNFNGGSEQTFFVEYKPFIANHWNCFAVINDTFGNNTTLRIHNLEYDIEYCVQIYSPNFFGGSNSTTKCSIRTNG